MDSRTSSYYSVVTTKKTTTTEAIIMMTTAPTVTMTGFMVALKAIVKINIPMTNTKLRRNIILITSISMIINRRINILMMITTQDMKMMKTTTITTTTIRTVTFKSSTLRIPTTQL